MNREAADLVLANAAELVTGSEDGKTLTVINKGWLAVKDERIVAMGQEGEVAPLVDSELTRVIDAAGKVVAPGFTDCHTHLVFGGSRVEEYAARLTIDDPKELEMRGIKTGIMVTVGQTRKASEEELYLAAEARLKRMLASGTTTVESKSGYGLSFDSEIKILKVNRLLDRNSPVDIVSTFLGAHGWPDDQPRGRYIDLLIKEMIPQVSELGLARFCDVWCDDGHYSAKESEMILRAGQDYGLEPKIHTDAYSYIGGSDLAAEMKMVSADHLNYTPVPAMKKMAKANVLGVLMPALDFAVKHPQPFDYPAMKAENLPVALATNLCPGCWTESMQFVLALACRLYKMSPAEALIAATLGGAKALGLEKDYGSLSVGKYADIQVWDIPCHEHLVYRLGGNVVEKVIKKGKLVIDHLPGQGYLAV